MKTATVITKLNKQFPGCNAVPSEEFDGSDGGIWFRNSEGCYLSDEMPMFDIYLHTDSFGTHPDFEAALEKMGFFSEAYDSGTLMAYHI